MKKALGDDALNEIFREARTHGAWLDKPVTDEILRQLYDLMKWGPTSANGSPGRLVFLRTPEAKERLRPALAPGNVEKTMAAPVTAIIAYDLLSFEKLPKLFPQATSSRISYATLAMAMTRNFSQEGHGWHSTRPARFYERPPIGVENSR